MRARCAAARHLFAGEQRERRGVGREKRRLVLIQVADERRQRIRHRKCHGMRPGCRPARASPRRDTREVVVDRRDEGRPPRVNALQRYVFVAFEA